MAGPDEQSQAESQFGDYRLVELFSAGARTRTYLAEQISMDRSVLLERIEDEARGDGAVVGSFLADVRAKAAVDHPGIGSVYEAVDDGEAIYYTREYLGGCTFHDLREQGLTISPALMATLLRQLGSAMEYLEQSGVAKLPLEPRHLFLGDHEVVRICNLAVAAGEGAAPAGHDRQLLADLCLDLLQTGEPGATRTRTLLNMMADHDGTMLSWTQVAHTSRKLEQDLSEGTMVASQAITTGPLRESAPWSPGTKAVLGLLVAVLVLAALAVGGLLLSNRKSPPRARDLGTMIEIPEGLYLTHDGKAVRLRRFFIDADEVTISEYAEFLEDLDRLPDEKRTKYDHVDQPAIKLDHFPDDWETMLNAARSGGTMEGLVIDLNHPVVGIDWWDATAYANWNRARLPTQEEWYAASQDGDPVPSERGAVDDLPGDVTPRGIHGLAGNVSEWVRDSAKNPAFPMNPRKPLCCGASYLHPRDGPRARTWMPTRETRRRDVGFRTVRDAAR